MSFVFHLVANMTPFKMDIHSQFLIMKVNKLQLACRLR